MFSIETQIWVLSATKSSMLYRTAHLSIIGLFAGTGGLSIGAPGELPARLSAAPIGRIGGGWLGRRTHEVVWRSWPERTFLGRRVAVAFLVRIARNGAAGEIRTADHLVRSRRITQTHTSRHQKISDLRWGVGLEKWRFDATSVPRVCR